MTRQPKLRVLVTGAGGFVGTAVCRRLAEAGHVPVALVRPDSAGSRRPPVPEYCIGGFPYDLPAGLCDGLDAVVHAAASLRGEPDAEARAVTVEGTRALLNLLSVHSPGARFVFLSSQSARADAPATYGKSKHDAELLVRSSGLPYAILRPGLVYGPGDAGLFGRMRGTIEKLPIVPLIGGGHAPMQPIEVSDLAEAILRCLLWPAERSGELNLGEREPISMREFLRRTAAALGRSRPMVTVPVGPLIAAARTARALRIPFPINPDNLAGMKAVRPMDTAESLDWLDLKLMPLDEGLRRACAPPPPASPAPVRAKRVLLVGAGKIGVVHALNLRRRPGLTLAGIVDPNAGARGLYSSMGFRAPQFVSVADALAAGDADGAIVATPAATHLALARECLSRGLAVLVEKPLAAAANGLDAFTRLPAEFPGAVLHTGYMMAQSPHLDMIAETLRAGTLGAVRRVEASAYQSHIMGRKPLRWEMIRAQSGGGVLINFAGHLIAVLLRLFGAPAVAAGAQWPIHSTEVEDALALRLAWAEFEGSLVTSWSASGFARPDNRIRIVCERGEMLFTNAVSVIAPAQGVRRVVAQGDCAAGFNAAPDYTGGAFAREHENWLAAMRGEAVPADALPSHVPVEVPEAARVEAFIAGVYAAVPFGAIHAGAASAEVRALIAAMPGTVQPVEAA